MRSVGAIAEVSILLLSGSRSESPDPSAKIGPDLNEIINVPQGIHSMYRAKIESYTLSYSLSTIKLKYNEARNMV
nr:hypothetical protein Iba_chr11fCG6930 [Ipomoea batatas]